MMLPTSAGYAIIGMVFFVAAISALLVAVGTYLVDKGASRRDR